MNFRHIETNNIRLHIAESGPEHGRLVILLHGFPEFWYSWRHQIEPLAAAGFHVVAVDQRGYNLSDKPDSIESYDLDLVCDDVLGIADALDYQTFNIVGHDWGALVAWWLAARNPDRIDRMAVLNATHPSIWREAIKNNRAQKKKSWYVGVLQIPWLPEWLMRQRRFDGLVKALKMSSRPDAFSDADLQKYRGAWQQPGADRDDQLVSRDRSQTIAARFLGKDQHSCPHPLGRQRSLRHPRARRAGKGNVHERHARIFRAGDPLGAA